MKNTQILMLTIAFCVVAITAFVIGLRLSTGRLQPVDVAQLESSQLQEREKSAEGIRKQHEGLATRLLELAGEKVEALPSSDARFVEYPWHDAKHLAILLLGDLRAVEGVPVLLDNLEYKNPKSRYVDEPLDESGWYPAAESLSKIGMPAVGPTVETLGSYEPNSEGSKICRWIIKEVLGARLGKVRLQIAIEETRDPTVKKNLTAVLPYFKTPQEKAAGVSTASCADSLSLTSHGGGMGLMLIVGGETLEVDWDPEETGSANGWSGDAEFVILHACDSIAWREGPGGLPPAAPEGIIEDVWIGNTSTGVTGDELFSTGIHAVLGYCATVWNVTFDEDLVEFWKHCHGGSTVADAWKQACLIGINTAYAVVVRESNLNDHIKPLWKGGQQLTRDSTKLADATTFIYYSYDIGTKVYGPPAGGSHTGSILNRYERIKTQIDKQIEFKGTYEVDKLAISGQAEHIRLNMQHYVAHNFDYISSTEFDFLASRRFDKLDSDKHTIEVTLDGLKQRLASVGLSIPPEYVFESTGEMMARRFGQGEGSGQTWCEGKVFRFTRQFDGNTIFSDTCIVAIRNADVILYSLRNHPIEKVGTQTIKKFIFKTKAGGIDPGQVDTKLLYQVKGSVIVPVWHVEYGDYLFKYDAITGRTYRDR